MEKDYIQIRAERGARKDLIKSVIVFFVALILIAEHTKANIIGGYTQSGYDFAILSAMAVNHSTNDPMTELINRTLAHSVEFQELMQEECVEHGTEQECVDWFASYGVALTFEEEINVPIHPAAPFAFLAVAAVFVRRRMLCVS